MAFQTGLRILVWDTYSKGYLVDELSDYKELRFTTLLHGGFGRLTLSIAMDLPLIWTWLSREGSVGRHFAHIEVLEEQRIVWEGRVMAIGFDVGAPDMALMIEAAGYWNSCRDQLYDAADSGNTDWTAGGPHTGDDIIKELLTKECPDINSDQSGIEDSSLNLAGIDLTARAYPQDIIIENLPHTSDGTDQWYFAIWEERLAFYKARAVDPVIWTTHLSELAPGSRLEQDAYLLRNNVLPVKDGVEGTAAGDSDSQSLYPVRDLMLTIGKGVPTAAENDERDRALAEKKGPRQSQTFVIDGSVLDTRGGGAGFASPLWRIRAGDSLRVEDLVPFSAASPTLDDLRTFFIISTGYDAVLDRAWIVPDRPLTGLSAILGRTVTVEPDR